MTTAKVLSCVITGTLQLNGVYDIACAACILWKDLLRTDLICPFHMLSTLHPLMFKEECRQNIPVAEKKEDDVTNEVKESPNSIAYRFLAYWVLTYGCARLVAGIKYDTSSDIIAAITYFLEALCFEWESRIGQTMNQEKVTFVSYFSFALGVLVLLRPTGVYGDPRQACSM